MAELASWARDANFARIRPSRPEKSFHDRRGHFVAHDPEAVFRDKCPPQESARHQRRQITGAAKTRQSFKTPIDLKNQIQT